MSYTPTEWKTGDVITSSGLNKMEEGIAAASSGGGGVLEIHATMVNPTTFTSDTLYSEVQSAWDANYKIRLIVEMGGDIGFELDAVGYSAGGGWCFVAMDSGMLTCMQIYHSEDPTSTIELGGAFYDLSSLAP